MQNLFLIACLAAFVLPVLPVLSRMRFRPWLNSVSGYLRPLTRLRHIALVGCVICLAGCAGDPLAAPAAGGATGTVSNSDLANIANFTISDLQTADADAVASHDDIAHQCYPALIKFVQGIPSTATNTTVAGAFAAFQRARDLRNVASGGIPTYLLTGCGPLYAQVHGDLLTFLAAVKI